MEGGVVVRQEALPPHSSKVPIAPWCEWCPVRDWHPIQGVALYHALCTWLRIHHNPALGIEFTEDHD